MDNITYKIKLSTGIPQIPKYKNVRTKHWEVVKPSYVSTSVGETKGKPVVRLTDLIIGETQNKQKLCYIFCYNHDVDVENMIISVMRVFLHRNSCNNLTSIFIWSLSPLLLVTRWIIFKRLVSSHINFLGTAFLTLSYTNTNNYSSREIQGAALSHLSGKLWKLLNKKKKERKYDHLKPMEIILRANNQGRNIYTSKSIKIW